MFNPFKWFSKKKIPHILSLSVEKQLRKSDRYKAKTKSKKWRKAAGNR